MVLILVAAGFLSCRDLCRT